MLRRIITIYVPDVSKYEEWVVSYFLYIEDFTIDLLKQIVIEKINDRMSGMTLSDEDIEKIDGYIKQIEDADCILLCLFGFTDDAIWVRSVWVICRSGLQ